jgi:hypothetical protein
MGKKTKLVLDKQTIKSIKIKTEIKTGESKACDGGIGPNPAQGTSVNYSRVASVAF